MNRTSIAWTLGPDGAPGFRYKPIDGFPGYSVGDDGTVWSA